MHGCCLTFTNTLLYSIIRQYCTPWLVIEQLPILTRRVLPLNSHHLHHYLEASDYKYADEVKRLKQENMQLRRDLADANNRIRELETTQQSTSLFVPSASYTDTEDDFSVEVSVTSSVTTAPTSNVARKGRKRNNPKSKGMIGNSL